jgi:hypothetical protein
MSMSIVLIVTGAIVAFLAVNTATLVLLGSTKARRDATAVRPPSPPRPPRLRVR